MDRTQRWTGCEHGRKLDGMVQYQRNLDRIEVFQDEAVYFEAFRSGRCTRCRVDTACIEEQATVQETYIVYEDDKGFVTRHDPTPLLMIFYRGVEDGQFAAWARHANQRMLAERTFWEFVDEDEQAHGMSHEVDALKARHRRFEQYIGRLVGLTEADRVAMMDAYEGMLMVYLAASSAGAK